MAIVGIDWQERARCRDHDVGIFFPERGEPAWTAKRICMGCGVRRECLEYALRRGEAEGIWGGLTPAERRRLARSRRALA